MRPHVSLYHVVEMAVIGGGQMHCRVASWYLSWSASFDVDMTVICRRLDRLTTNCIGSLAREYQSLEAGYHLVQQTSILTQPEVKMKDTSRPNRICLLRVLRAKNLLSIRSRPRNLWMRFHPCPSHIHSLVTGRRCINH